MWNRGYRCGIGDIDANNYVRCGIGDIDVE